MTDYKVKLFMNHNVEADSEEEAIQIAEQQLVEEMRERAGESIFGTEVLKAEATDGIHIEIKGTFSFSVNQNGYNLYDKKERQNAIDDFWAEFEAWEENGQQAEISGNLMYDGDKLEVTKGE